MAEEIESSTSVELSPESPSSRLKNIGGGPSSSAPQPSAADIDESVGPAAMPLPARGLKGATVAPRSPGVGGISADLIGNIVNRLSPKSLHIIVIAFAIQVILGALNINIGQWILDYKDYRLEVLQSAERQNLAIEKLEREMYYLQVTRGVPVGVPLETPAIEATTTVTPTVELPSPTPTQEAGG